MSKSAGNTFLVRELLREFTADELRYFLLSCHYRDDMEFSIPKLKASARKFVKLASRAKKMEGFKRGRAQSGRDSMTLLSSFYSAMDDDFDTPKAIEWVEDELIGSNRPGDAAYSALQVVSNVLGVHFAKS
jgi:cysteinyl-tRNA synthetase